MHYYQPMTDLEIAAHLDALIKEAMTRNLMKETYHQNAKSLSRHVGRIVLENNQQEILTAK